MRLLLSLFSRLSVPSSSSSHTVSKRALSSAPSSIASTRSAFLSAPDLPPGLVLTHAKTALAAQQRAEVAIFWFMEGFCPSEIALGLRPEKPYSISTIRLYIVRHARDSSLFRSIIEFDPTDSATSPLRAKVQFNRLRLFDEGRYALLPICELLFQKDVKLKDIAKRIRVRLDTIKVFLLTLALLDTSMRSLVETQLQLVLGSGKKSRFTQCSTFEEGCEVMKVIQHRPRFMAVFTEESVEKYEHGIAIGGRINRIRFRGKVGSQKRTQPEESFDYST
ncbi:hypothetical protein BDY24DRAFT_396764 [Mrakia frigida]|uniref:uncharacterized protein n=1 Tax=Mrakia frigida TaxID=29902 RepID=UPI003FCC10E8